MWPNDPKLSRAGTTMSTANERPTGVGSSEWLGSIIVNLYLTRIARLHRRSDLKIARVGRQNEDFTLLHLHSIESALGSNRIGHDNDGAKGCDIIRWYFR
jgi:hypothetical protein